MSADPYNYAQATLRLSELRLVVDTLAALVADGRDDLAEPLSKLRRDLERRDG